MKRFVYFSAIFLGLYLVFNLSRSIYDLSTRQEKIKAAQDELNSEKRKFEELSIKKEHVESDEFVEKEARDKLLFAKPGESKILIDEQLYSQTEAPASASAASSHRQNWQKWFELFFR